MTPATAEALKRAHYIYLTTYSQAGKPGTVPTWCWLHDDALYFTTQRASLKARRIQNTGRVAVNVGKKGGPAFEGHAEWVDDRPDLEAAILRGVSAQVLDPRAAVDGPLHPKGSPGEDQRPHPHPALSANLSETVTQCPGALGCIMQRPAIRLAHEGAFA